MNYPKIWKPPSKEEIEKEQRDKEINHLLEKMGYIVTIAGFIGLVYTIINVPPNSIFDEPITS